MPARGAYNADFQHLQILELSPKTWQIFRTFAIYDKIY